MCAVVRGYGKKRYLEQYDRILRWRDRLNNKDINYEIYKDNLLAFFVNCWNLKDWLERDPSIIFEEIKDDIYKSHNLKLCQSIATASKHLFITNTNILPIIIYQELNITPDDNYFTKKATVKIRQDTKGGYTLECTEGNLDPYDLDQITSEIEILFFVTNDCGFTIDAFELADNCISDWENILIKHDV